MCEEAHHSHFQSSWMTWSWPDKCHISPQPPWYHWKFQAKTTESLALSIHFSMPKCPSCICSNTLLLNVEGITSLAPFVMRSVFHGEIFSVVPKSVKFSWQHSSVNWPSHMYVVSQKIGCHVSSCLHESSHFTGTHRNAGGDKIHCNDR